MTGRRWAISPTDNESHLLLDDDQQPPHGLMARCATELPETAIRVEKPTANLCPYCWAFARAQL
jgi:hypothetical protein